MYVNARSLRALHTCSAFYVGQSVTNSQNICLVKVLKLRRRCSVERGCPALACTTNTKQHIAMPGMSDLQLFPVSSLLIGSRLLAKSMADLKIYNKSHVEARPSGVPRNTCLFTAIYVPPEKTAVITISSF